MRPSPCVGPYTILLHHITLSRLPIRRKGVIALFKMMVEAKKTHGGARRGAGRPRSGLRRGGPHRARPALSHYHPVHVTLRTERDVPRLRQGCIYRALRRVLVRYLGRGDFRIVHISIQHNHIHLIVEAADARALTRGMQSFAINAARAVNTGYGHIGKVFAYRYHATQIRTARYARNAISYVVNNWRRHREDFFDGRTRAAQLDPYSSAVSFTGWTRRFATPANYTPLPVSQPETDLLRTDWLRFGRIDPHERPGPLW